MTTKAERIRVLYNAGISPRNIAEIVGCRTEYVRVAARQRADGKCSSIDKRYQESPKGQIDHRIKRAASEAYMRALWDSHDKELASTVYENARIKAKRDGCSPEEMKVRIVRARFEIVKATGDRELARREARKARARVRREMRKEALQNKDVRNDSHAAE